MLYIIHLGTFTAVGWEKQWKSVQMHQYFVILISVLSCLKFVKLTQRNLQLTLWGGGTKKNKHLLPGQGLCVVNKKLSVEKIDEQKRKKTR